jgi:xylose dehydrogenase (NAD/NADP)
VNLFHRAEYIFRVAVAGSMSLREWLDGYDRRDWQTADADDGPVRFALVGLGWWTTDVAMPAIGDSTFCGTTVLVSSSREKAERVGAGRDVDHAIAYDEFHDGAATDAYDAVYVATPNALHSEYVESAAAHGKAVLCEKPLEATVERGRRLVEAAEDAGVPLMTGYRMQTEPAVRRARELIADGFLGDPVHAHGTNTQPVLEMIPDPDQWRLDPDLTGYGTSVMDLGIYPINTARYLLDRDPVAAGARTRSPNGAFADVPDERAAFTLTHEDDIPLLATASQNAQGDSRLTITGTEGRVELRPAFHGTATLRAARGDVSAEITTGYDARRETEELFDYFADRVLTGAPVDPDGRHGLADLRTIRAIHEAAEHGGTVEIADGV